MHKTFAEIIGVTVDKNTMTRHLREIIGKTVAKIILRERLSNDPRCQLFIEFSDETHFEFYTSEEMINPVKGLLPCKVRQLGKNEKAIDVVRVE